MSFERVVLTDKELRNYKPSMPPLSPHPLQATLDATKATSHVSPEFALAVAMDLIGIEQALTFVRGTPAVLMVWVNLLETHGWAHNLRQQDLQVNLLVNAIKVVVNFTHASGLEREGKAYELIKQSCQGDEKLEMALTYGLLINKGIDLPWTVIANLPLDPNDKSYGIWSGG